jgi:general secretion pathway protein G
MRMMNDECGMMMDDSNAQTDGSSFISHHSSLPPRAQRGFTLIELLVVITIIGILAGIAVANVKWAQTRAREAALKSDLREMRGAIDNFYADKQHYPQSLNELKDQHYLRAIPKDPITEKAEWEEVQAPVDQTDPNGSAADPTAKDNNDQNGGQAGIYDVRSRATGKALNGEEYKSW